MGDRAVDCQGRQGKRLSFPRLVAAGGLALLGWVQISPAGRGSPRAHHQKRQAGRFSQDGGQDAGRFSQNGRQCAGRFSQNGGQDACRFSQDGHQRRPIQPKRPPSRPRIPSRPAPRESIERRPYRISFHLQCDPSARIDLASRADLLREWQVLERRFIGPPWVVTIEPASSPLASLDFEALEPEAFSALSSFDKVWVVRISRPPSEMGLLFTGREYDMAARRLGALQTQMVYSLGDAPVLCWRSHSISSIRPPRSPERRAARDPENSGGGDHAGEPGRSRRLQGNRVLAAAAGIAA